MHSELSYIRENLYEGRGCGWEEDGGGEVSGKNIERAILFCKLKRLL